MVNPLPDIEYRLYTCVHTTLNYSNLNPFPIRWKMYTKTSPVTNADAIKHILLLAETVCSYFQGCCEICISQHMFDNVLALSLALGAVSVSNSAAIQLRLCCWRNYCLIGSLSPWTPEEATEFSEKWKLEMLSLINRALNTNFKLYKIQILFFLRLKTLTCSDKYDELFLNAVLRVHSPSLRMTVMGEKDTCFNALQSFTVTRHVLRARMTLRASCSGDFLNPSIKCFHFPQSHVS